MNDSKSTLLIFDTDFFLLRMDIMMFSWLVPESYLGEFIFGQGKKVHSFNKSTKKKNTKNFCDVIDVSIRPKIPDDDYDKVYKKSKKKKKFSWQHQISIKD